MPHTNEYRERIVQTVGKKQYVTLGSYNNENTHIVTPCSANKQNQFVLVNNVNKGYDSLTSESGNQYDSVLKAYPSQCDSMMLRGCEGGF